MKTIAGSIGAALILLSVFSPVVASEEPLPARVFLPAVSSQPAPVEKELYFEIARVVRCDPNAGITYANGTVAVDRQPANGYAVAFSYAADGPIVATTVSGPHEGYPYWDPGFFSHILGATGPREGDWHFWIVDETGKRISAIAHFRTDGSAHEGSCQQAILAFDTQYPGGTAILPPR